MPKKSDESYQGARDRGIEIFDRHAVEGYVTLRYETHGFLGGV